MYGPPVSGVSFHHAQIIWFAVSPHGTTISPDATSPGNSADGVRLDFTSAKLFGNRLPCLRAWSSSIIARPCRFSRARMSRVSCSTRPGQLAPCTMPLRTVTRSCRSFGPQVSSDSLPWSRRVSGGPKIFSTSESATPDRTRWKFARVNRSADAGGFVGVAPVFAAGPLLAAGSLLAAGPFFAADPGPPFSARSALQPTRATRNNEEKTWAARILRSCRAGILANSATWVSMAGLSPSSLSRLHRRHFERLPVLVVGGPLTGLLALV